ncbi:MAG: hypothetical protein FWC46_01280 [Actinomycetia bacterium]|nr:hypothetical protein [Actinomycetes bacterium]
MVATSRNHQIEGVQPKTTHEIELTRDGCVCARNHVRRGYARLTQGAYVRTHSTDNLTPDAIRRARWWALVRGVARLYEDRDIVLFGPTALQALGVALPARLEDWDACHVQVVGRRPERRGVVAHRPFARGPVWRRIGGVPVLHPVDHWLQLRGATDDELIEVGDGLLRRRRPLLTPGDLAARLDALDRVYGVDKARRVVRWLRPGTDSLYETRTRLVLVRAGLPCPAVNPEVWCRAAGRMYHPDMAYEAERVAVEYDGAGHVGAVEQMDIDARRRRELQDEGWMVINVTARQLGDPAPLVRSVEAALVLGRTHRWAA